MATYDIDKITLPNGDVCNLKNNGLVACCNTIVNSGPYVDPPLYNDGENPLSECWWLNTTNNLTYNLYNADGVMEFVGTGSVEFQLVKPYMYNSNIFEGWDALNWHDGDKGILSCDIKCSVPLKFRMGLAEINSTLGNLTAMQSSAADAPTYNCTDWTRAYFPFTIPTGWNERLTAPTTTRIYIVFLGTLVSGQTMYFRNAMLSHGDTHTIYSPSSQDAVLINGNQLKIFEKNGTSYLSPTIRFYHKNGSRQDLTGSILATRRNFGDGVSAPGRIQLRQNVWNSTTQKASDVYECYTFPETDDNRASNVTYGIWTTKNIPNPPSANGTYTLKVTVSNGSWTFSWV